MRFFLPAACLVLGLLPGCTCGSPSSSAAPVPSAGSSAVASSSAPAIPSGSAPDPRLARPPRHGGFVGLLLRTAREGGASAEQKARVLTILQTLHDAEPPFSPLKEYEEHFAAAIRAGQVDPAKFQPDYVAVDGIEVQREAKQAEALEALHGVLEPTARHTLVELVRTRLTPMFRVRPELPPPEAGQAGGELPWVKQRVARLGGDLGLDDGQKAKAAVILARASAPPKVTDAKKEAMHKHADALLDAFDKDDFDAKKLDLSADGLHTPAHASLEHEAVLVGQILPILTPEQREKLAVQKGRRVGRWLEDPEPWSPFEDYEPGPRMR